MEKVVEIDVFFANQKLTVPFIVTKCSTPILFGRPFLREAQAFIDEGHDLLYFAKLHLFLQDREFKDANTIDAKRVKEITETGTFTVNHVAVENTLTHQSSSQHSPRKSNMTTTLFDLSSGDSINLSDTIPLSEAQRHLLIHVLETCETAFYQEGDKLPTAGQFSIDVLPSIYQQRKRRNPYPLNPQDLASVKHHIEEGIKLKFLRRAEPGEHISVTSPCFIKKEKNKPHGRLCVDYGFVNDHSKLNVYPLPRISALLSKLASAKFVSLFDAKSAYHSFELEVQTQRLLSIVTPDGLYCPLRLPFGTASAPGFFQSHMDALLQDLDFAYAYLDDILIISETFDDHLQHIATVLTRTERAGLRLSKKKAQILPKTFKYLGWEIKGQTRHPDPGKVKAIKDWAPLKSKKAVQKFLGLCNYLMDCIPHLAYHTVALRETIKKKTFKMTDEATKDFEELKKLICNTVELHHYNPNLPTILHTDASQFASGCVLSQTVDDKEVPIAFYSAAHHGAQLRYCATDLELLAIQKAIRHFKTMLIPGKITIYTDHQPLQQLFRKNADLNRRNYRYVQEILELRPNIVYCSGKDNAAADALSRQDNHLEKYCAAILSSIEFPIYPIFLVEATDNYDVIKHEQNVDDEAAKIITALKNDTDEALHYKKLKYSMDNGILKYDDKFYIPKGLREIVLSDAHNTHHPGWNKMFYRMHNVYFWPKMARDIQRFCEKCTVCLQFKDHQHRAVGLFSPRHVGSPFNLFSIDVLEMNTSSTQGSYHVLVIQDTFTRYIELIPLKTQTAREVAEKLYQHLVLRYGPPTAVLTDNGGPFISQIFQALTKLYDISKNYGIPRSATSNAMNERSHRTILGHLRTLLTGYSEKWEDVLPIVAYTFNTSTIGHLPFTPYELMFGKKPRELHIHDFTQSTPLDILKPIDKEMIRTWLKYVQDIREQMNILSEMLQRNQLERVNLQRQIVTYTPGEQVLLSVDDRTHKLEKQKVPAIVTKVIGNNYEVQYGNTKITCTPSQLTKIYQLTSPNWYHRPATRKGDTSRALTQNFILEPNSSPTPSQLQEGHFVVIRRNKHIAVGKILTIHPILPKLRIWYYGSQHQKAPIRNHKFAPLYLDSMSAPTFDSEEPAVSRFTDMIPTDQVIATFEVLDEQLRLPSDVTIPPRVKLTNGFV